MHAPDETEGSTKPATGPALIFKWTSLREVAPYLLRFKDPIQGKSFQVELTSGRMIHVFRSDDGEFYFCHGLTFGGKTAPGGAVSPFSGEDVRTILENHYRLIDPEAGAIAGDILVWKGPSGETPHSAILLNPLVVPGKPFLDCKSLLRSKNGKLPEADVTLQQLIDGPEGYGEAYNVFRLK
jgi:hypothetical protein